MRLAAASGQVSCPTASTSARQLQPSARQAPAHVAPLRRQPRTRSHAPFSSTAAPCMHHQRIAGRCKASAEDDVQAIEDVRLPQLSTEALHEEQEWLAGSVRVWLDEEWTVLEEHQQLGTAVSHAYGRLRNGGADDLTDVLLGMSSDLMQTFDFKPTFVNAFDVANKVSELLMMRHMGEGSCCTTDADRERFERMPSSTGGDSQAGNLSS